MKQKFLFTIQMCGGFSLVTLMLIRPNPKLVEFSMGLFNLIETLKKIQITSLSWQKCFSLSRKICYIGQFLREILFYFLTLCGQEGQNRLEVDKFLFISFSILPKPIYNQCRKKCQSFKYANKGMWSCGLFCHGLDREVKGSNLAAAGSHRFNFFNAGSHQFSLVKRRWKAEEREKRWKVET